VEQLNLVLVWVRADFKIASSSLFYFKTGNRYPISFVEKNWIFCVCVCDIMYVCKRERERVTHFQISHFRFFFPLKKDVTCILNYAHER